MLCLIAAGILGLSPGEIFPGVLFMKKSILPHVTSYLCGGGRLHQKISIPSPGGKRKVLRYTQTCPKYAMNTDLTLDRTNGC